MSRALYRLGRVTARHPWRVVSCWVIVVGVIAGLAATVGGKPVDDYRIPGTETQRTIDLLTQKYPSQSGVSARLVLHARHGTLHDRAAQRAIERLRSKVGHQPGVVQVSSLVTPKLLGISHDDGTIGLINVQFRGQVSEVGSAGTDRLEAAARTARSHDLQVELGGDLPNYTAQRTTGASEAIGVAVAILVLLLAFGSVVAMGLPIGTAIVALASGLMLITVVSSVVHVSAVAPIIATMIGLGVGIDYSLFIVTRHREHLREGMTVAESVARAMATAGQAVLFAGTTVVIAIVGLALVGIPAVTAMGAAAAMVVAITVLASLTLLPALMALLGRRIDKWRVPGVKGSADRESHKLAHRWSQHVSHHRWTYLLGCVALLGVLTIPFFSIRLGQTDAGNNPKGSTTRKAFDLTAKGFGPGFNGPLVVAVDFGGPVAKAKGSAALGSLAQRLGKTPGVARALPVPGVSPDRQAGVVTVFPTDSPQSKTTQDLVHRLRHQVDGLRSSVGASRILVGGATAAFVDISDKLSAALPYFIGTVLVLSFLLLMLVFRSILVPLKAALVNLLGIAAAYGVVVAVFQWGWLKAAVGIHATLPIVSFLPMFMFAILFGLSMDYEVFLMSRIREEYLTSHDNLRSVGRGIDTTARVITAAAVIMVSVFASFVLVADPQVKMMGLGLATAILLDATVVRMVLVPATMALLGDANWWLPRWLDRLLPNVHIEGPEGLPAPEYEPGLAPAPSQPEQGELVGASD